MRQTRVPVLAALAAVLLAGRAAGQDADRPPPRYALPDGFPRGGSLDEPLRSAVARAVEDVTRPHTPYAAREGWRVLAGIGAPAAPATVAALGEADWFGRSLLVRALGSMGEPALEPVLVEAAGDPAWAVREAAAEGLGLAAGDGSARALPPLLSDPSWRVRLAALAAVRARSLLGGLRRDAAAAAILPLARDADPDVRRAAWLALADLRDPLGRTALLEALDLIRDEARDGAESAQDTSYPTALRILRGLSEAWGGDPAVRETLWKLGDEPGHALAGAALREWFRLGGDAAARDPEGLRRLVKVYVGRNSTAESVAAAEAALADLGEPAAQALFEAVAKPERPREEELPAEVMRFALRLLLRLRADRAAETLAALVGDGRLPAPLRAEAARLGSRACAAALGPVFREVWARGEGIYALDVQVLRGIAASGGADVKGIVAKALLRTEGDQPALPVRAAAAEVLDGHPELRDPEAILRAVAVETDADTVARLLPVLAACAGPAAPGAVAPFLRDPRVRVRRAAARALAVVPGPEATRVLQEAMAAEDGGDERLAWHGEGKPSESDLLDMAAEKAANAGSVREVAVSSLRFTAGPKALEVLAPLLDHADPGVRAAAAANLATLGDPAAAAPLAARAERETEPGLRPKILTALATLGGPGADAAFGRFLTGGEESLRVLALEVLGDERARPRVRALEGILRSARRPDAAPMERIAALKALGLERDPPQTPFLLEALAKAAAGEERRAAIEALGRTRDPAAAERIASLLPAGDPARLGADELESVALAVETLADLHSPAAAAPLASLLARALPRALSGAGGRSGDGARQVAALAVRALGRCGGEVALDALVRAAFQSGFSRAAEAATTDPLRPRPPRREDERWRPSVPDDLRPLALQLACALARWRDGDLCAALGRRLAEMRSDGRVFAVSEEWLSWLGRTLGDPPQNVPNRPRGWAKILLLRQVLANPPRRSEADAEAAGSVFFHDADYTMEYGLARREVAEWRDCLRLLDPLAADRDARVLEGLDAVCAAGAALRGGAGDEAAAAMPEAFERSGRSDRVARLAADVLKDLGRALDVAESMGDAAVRADSRSPHNLRVLGEVRLARGDAVGAADVLESAVEDPDGASLQPSRNTAWGRYVLARALTALGETEEALAAVGTAARLNDNLLYMAERDPAFAPLREGGRLDEALDEARRLFEE